MIDVLAAVRAHVGEYFDAASITAEPVSASVTFLGTERVDILRFGPDLRAGGSGQDLYHYVTLGCSRHPMFDPTELVSDPIHGPRAEVVLSLRGPTPGGLARSRAVLAAAPAGEGLVLEADALVDLETPLFDGAPFSAFLLGASDIGEVALPEPLSPVTVFTATPITATEAAWVRLKGADAMREAWQTDGVDVLDPARRAASPS